MGIIFAILGAIIVSFLATWLYPGKVPLNILERILLGLGGGLVGKCIGFLLGLGFSGGLVTSVIGALVLIFLYKRYKHLLL